MFKNYRKWIYSLAIILATIFGFIYITADTVNISGIAPTTNTDSSPVSLSSIRLYKAVVTGAAPNCTTATYSVYQTIAFSTAGGTFTYVDANQNVTGRHCYKATAVSTAGVESAFSPIAFKDIDTRIPNPPTNLTVN